MRHCEQTLKTQNLMDGVVDADVDADSDDGDDVIVKAFEA